MRTALQLPIENSLGRSGYWSLIQTLNLLENNIEKHVELHIANKIFVASYVTVKPVYQELTTKVFLSSSQCIDFTDSRTAAKTINTWCENQTNNKVTEVVQRDSFGPDTVLVLVNALYFKGQWKYPFTRLRLKSRFFSDKKSRVWVNSMVIKHHFRFGDLPKQDAKFLEIPYKDESLSMIIILPNSMMGLTKIQDNLHQLNLRQSLQAVIPRFVEIDVPEFKIECSVNLTPILETLGMTSMFGAAADFSGIADSPLNVTKAVQTAIIEVTDIYTPAAAAPSWRVAREDDGTITPTFIVDQPFYFMIYHNPTGISLFTGIVKHSNCFI